MDSMTIAMWAVGIIGGFLLLLVLIGVGVWLWTRQKRRRSFNFLLFSRDPNAMPQVIKGQVGIDKQNKNDRWFFFEQNSTRLPIRAPTLFLNKIAYREITYGDDGNYVYLKGKKFDRDKYMEIALDPVEKSIALSQLKDNQKSFEAVMNKYQAYALMAVVILIIFLTVGTIYSSIAYAKASSDHVKLAQENSNLQKDIRASIKVMNEISIRNAEIVTAITGKPINVNVTRQIT